MPLRYAFEEKRATDFLSFLMKIFICTIDVILTCQCGHHLNAISNIGHPQHD